MCFLATVSLNHMTSEYGPLYDHYNRNTLSLNQEELDFVGEAFHLALNNPENENQQIVRSLQAKVDQLTSHMSRMINLTENTRGLISYLQSQSHLNSNTQIALSRMLASNSTNLTSEVCQRLQNKLLEIESQRLLMGSQLENIQRKLKIMDHLRQQ